MLKGKKFTGRHIRLLMLMLFALVVAASPVAGVFAGQLAGMPGRAAVNPNQHTPPQPPEVPGDAYAYLTPDTDVVGNCPAPVNGGTVQVGCRFVLDLRVNTGD